MSLMKIVDFVLFHLSLIFIFIAILFSYFGLTVRVNAMSYVTITHDT